MVAAFADLVAVTVAPVAIAMVAVERFPIVSPASGSRFSPEDQQQINEIARGFNRAVEIDGTVYALSGAGWWWTVALLAASTLAIHVVVPTLSGGQSPGKTLVGLRVVSAGGGRPGIGQHLLRTMGGLVDIVPVVIPGLLGFVLAAFDADRRRFGDWMARTAVVDDRLTRWAGEIGANRLSATSETFLSAPRSPDRSHPAVAGSAEIILAESHPTRPGAERPEPGGEVAIDLSTGRPGPASKVEPTLESSPLPPPARRPRPTPGGLDRTSRQPGRQLTSGRLPARPSTARTPFQDLALPESSLAESPLTATALALVAEPAAATTGGATATATATGGGDPVWSERCGAWVYQDPGSGRWFRHDTGSGRWQALDRGTQI